MPPDFMFLLIAIHSQQSRATYELRTPFADGTNGSAPAIWPR